MRELLNYPFDALDIARKKLKIRKTFTDDGPFVEKRIAILGGSTTGEVRDFLELFLLHAGIRPTFYESEFNQFYEEGAFENSALRDFAPEVIFVHTSTVNVRAFPPVSSTASEVAELLDAETERFGSLWDALSERYRCPIVQNNFEWPLARPLGNLDASAVQGKTRYLAALNQAFADAACERDGLHLCDINYLASWLGLSRWYDRNLWYVYKCAMSMEGMVHVGFQVANIVRALFGCGKKCLVVDLDDTVWGGVVGDDGVEGLTLGPDTPEGEAFSDFQAYLRDLKERGVILAVCSKNDPDAARSGFAHPDSILRLDDFSAFQANWDEKDGNIRAIADHINIGCNSLVFVDDNPAERELVRSQVPEVFVPEIGQDVAKFLPLLDKSGAFETVSLSKEDLARTALYAQEAQRTGTQSKFANYEEYLASLEMESEIDTFKPVYLDRIAQLTNRTNQFNLTTKRCTLDDIKGFADSPDHLCLYGKLADRFGDSGLVSVVVGEHEGSDVHVHLWLMSCRVLKRGLEAAMLDRIVEESLARGVSCIVGHYYPTERNAMVADHYGRLGFECSGRLDSGESEWRLENLSEYAVRNRNIELRAFPDEA